MTHLLCMSEPYFTGSVLKLASVFNWLTFCILSLSASFHHIYFILSSPFHSCAFSLPFFCIFLLIEETPLLAFKPTSVLQIFFSPLHILQTHSRFTFSPLCHFVPLSTIHSFIFVVLLFFLSSLPVPLSQSALARHFSFFVCALPVSMVRILDQLQCPALPSPDQTPLLHSNLCCLKLRSSIDVWL